MPAAYCNENFAGKMVGTGVLDGGEPPPGSGARRGSILNRDHFQSTTIG
jgi:hypothetical protein